MSEQPQKVDQDIQCEDCRTVFVFPVRDQEFFEKKGYQWPKRCKFCRLKKKQRFDEFERTGTGPFRERPRKDDNEGF